MKLARRLILVVAAVLLGLLALDGYFEVRREQEVVQEDVERDGSLLGQAVAEAMAATREGRHGALELTDKDQRVSIRVVSTEDAYANRRPAAPPEALRDLRPGSAVHWSEPNGARFYTYVPLAHEPHSLVEISENLAPLSVHIRTLILSALARDGATAVAFLSLLLAVGLVYVGRPLRELADMARRIGAGDFSMRVSFSRRDGFRDLAEAMNGMCGGLTQAREQIEAETRTRIAAVEQLRHADRLATVGQLAAGIAHELGTPLNVISGRAKMIAVGEVVGAEATESSNVIIEQTRRMTRIIRGLLDFSRRRPAQQASAALEDVVRETVRLLGPAAQKKRVTMSVEASNPGVVSVDVGQIQQVLTNLVMNAIQAVSQGGSVTLRVNRGRLKPPADHGGAEDEYVSLVVRDDGPGIKAEDLPHIFEPFFTTKDVGEGTGLGLAVAHGLVRENGGWIAVESGAGRGASFTIFLPRPSDKEPEAEARAASEAALREGAAANTNVKPSN